MQIAAPPPDLEKVLDKAWRLTERTAGFLGEKEARFLGMMVACLPVRGAIVEIGSFKGKSTVLLASVAAHYGLGPVVAIDPHTAPSTTDPAMAAGASTFEAFRASIKAAGVEAHVEAHRKHSREAARGWNQPIAMLWIDGDHTYAGAKEDFDMFTPHLVSGGVVALHDSLNAFEGPIRVFVEEILRSERYGPAGVVQSTAWAQFRPEDGKAFRDSRSKLERRARRLLPFLINGQSVQGLRKVAYKLARSRVPRGPISAAAWTALISQSGSE